MPSQSIQKRIQSLTPEYKQFILSEYLEITIDFFAKNYNLKSSDKINFENCLLLYLMLFINKYELIELIIKNCNIKIVDAIYIVKTITDSLPEEMDTQMSINISLFKEETEAPIKDTLRNSVLNNASNIQLYKYFLCRTNQNFANLVTIDLSDKLTQLAGDIILGFYKIEDTIPLLQQELEINEANARQLGGEVQDFLAPLSDPTWQPPIDEDGENTEFSNQITNEVSPVTLSTLEVVAQIEEPRHHEPIAIPEIRTMAADMAIERSPARNTFNAAAEIDELVHVSNQPTLEKKIVDVPSYSSSQYQSPKPDAPTTDSRWN